MGTDALVEKVLREVPEQFMEYVKIKGLPAPTVQEISFEEDEELMA